MKLIKKKRTEKKQKLKVKTPADIAAKEVNKTLKDVIFFDLDGTLVDSIGGVLSSLEIKYHPEKYEISDWRVTEEQKQKVIKVFSDVKFYEEAKLFHTSKAVVSILSEFYELVIITARPLQVHNSTIKYCNTHFPEIKHILFSSKEESKSAIVNKFHNAFAIVEDCPNNMIDIIENCLLSEKSDLCHIIAVDHKHQPYTLLDWKDIYGNSEPLAKTDYRHFISIKSLYKIVYFFLHNYLKGRHQYE